MVRESTSAYRCDLTGKVAVVLGASAEGGSGWATAALLAANGAQLVVGARSLAPLQVLADRIGGHAVACDAGDEGDVAALARAAIDLHGRVDIAVNAAGLPVRSAIAELDQQQLDLATRVNYFANVYFIKHMAEAIGRDGSIVLFSSMGAAHVVAPQVAYAAAKAASDCLVRYAAIEYGARGIRVNSLLPGPINSALARERFAIPGVIETFAREIPLGRVGEPEDFADAVLWLASDSYVTGLNIELNGGNHLTRLPRLDEFPAAPSAQA